jgi:dipeptidyl aminopeptidase/acylaminoacyl peptidase/CubicO group peptidase (beta-lactamase class C family)
MAQQRVSIDNLIATQLPEQPALSPDGGSIAYVLKTTNRAEDRDERSLWLVAAEGGEPRRLTRGTGDSTPRWSPDGTRLAFLRAQDGPPQIWVLPIGGGEAEQVTTQTLGADAPVWSGDGTRIAFSGPIDSAALPGEGSDDFAKRRTAPIVTNRLGYKADGAGLLGTLRKHIHVVNLGSGEITQLTRGDWHAGDPVWSPDGERIAFSTGKEADSDLTFETAAYVMSSSDGNARPRLVGAADVQLAVTGWTPDAAKLIAVGRTDAEVGNASVLLVPLDGGAPRDITSTLDRNVMPGGAGYPGALPQLSADGQTVIFCLRDGGYTHLYATSIDGAVQRVIVGGAANVSGASVVGNTAAIVLATETSFGEVSTVDLCSGTVTVLTSYSPEETGLIVAEPRSFTISDGFVVHGWLRRNPQRTGPLPLLLDVHGGPHNAWNGAADPFHAYHHELVARGWAVLTVNPRGSDGYGNDFFRGALGGWGTSDAKDFLEPIGDLVAEGVANPARLAVTGYSYGGFMACYLTSRDNRFAAAVAGGVVADLTSVAGTSDAGHFLSRLETGALPWKNPELLAPQSPYSQVGQVRTPTLIVQGAEDHRCPVGQAEQWFTALREQDVPSELVLYPGGSHLFILSGAPSHRADWNERIVDWVERYAPAAGTPVRKKALNAAHWQQRLSELAAAHKVPGATLGILRLGEEPVLASHGVLNINTGVETTDDSVFQIGSISKVWTATVIMQLVDEGKLDLDAPIVDVVPEFRVADAEVSKSVTMRHLLTHTSGIDGDVFTDTGRGDDCLEKYVDALSEVKQNHPIGATFSYCNSGFALMGRVIEKLTGLSWDDALRNRLFTPLGLKHTVTLPEEALLHRAAAGHVGADENGPILAPMWSLPRSLGPAGLIDATAADALEFARMHLKAGLAADGTRILSAESAELMTTHQTDVPDPYVLGDSWGLGWIRFDWGGKRLYGHDGNTIGQAAFLRILPEDGIAVTLLTNGGNTHDLYIELYNEIFGELAEISIPGSFGPPAEPYTGDMSPYLGTYERSSVVMEVFKEEEAMRMRTTVSGIVAESMPNPVEVYALTPVSDGKFALRAPGTQEWLSLVFYALPTGEQYVHFGARAMPKVAL